MRRLPTGAGGGDRGCQGDVEEPVGPSGLPPSEAAACYPIRRNPPRPVTGALIAKGVL